MGGGTGGPGGQPSSLTKFGYIVLMIGKKTELSKDIQMKIIKCYKVGQGYKKIDKAFLVPVSTMQTLINNL